MRNGIALYIISPLATQTNFFIEGFLMTSEISESSKTKELETWKGTKDNASPALWPSLHIEDQFLSYVPLLVCHHKWNSPQFPGVAQSVAANSVQCSVGLWINHPGWQLTCSQCHIHLLKESTKGIKESKPSITIMTQVLQDVEVGLTWGGPDAWHSTASCRDSQQVWKSYIHQLLDTCLPYTGLLCNTFHSVI